MSEKSNTERVNVLGVGISVLNLESARKKVIEALDQKRKGYVCVTGVHGVMEAQRDESLRKILNSSFLNTPDGMPMVWVGKLNGYNTAGFFEVIHIRIRFAYIVQIVCK